MTKRMKWGIPTLVLAAAIPASLYYVFGGPPPSSLAISTTSTLIREATPDAILDYVRAQRSPVVLINFWASWCEPCKEEFPFIMNLKRDLAGKGLRVVLVSVDDPGDLSAAESFLKLQGVDFQTFYKGTQPLSFVTHLYPKWTGAVPATVLMGPELQILDSWEGDTTQAEFEKRIQKFLPGT